jgi:hypothetical protein
VSPAGNITGDQQSFFVQVSGNGSQVLFQSFATTLAPLDTNGAGDVFVGAAPTGTGTGTGSTTSTGTGTTTGTGTSSGTSTGTSSGTSTGTSSGSTTGTGTSTGTTGGSTTGTGTTSGTTTGTGNPFASIPPGQPVPTGSIRVSIVPGAFRNRRLSLTVTLTNTTAFTTGPLNVYLLGLRRFTLPGASGFTPDDVPFIRGSLTPNGSVTLTFQLGLRTSRLFVGDRLKMAAGLAPTSPKTAALVTVATVS